MGADQAARVIVTLTEGAARIAGPQPAMFSFSTAVPSPGQAAGNQWLHYPRPKPSIWP